MMTTFSHPRNELHFTTYDVTEVAAALEAGEKKARAAIEELVAIPDNQRTFENTMLTFSRCDEEMSQVAEIVWHLDSVLSGEWRGAAQLAEEKVSMFATEVMHDKRIYEALKAIKVEGLPANYQRLLHETIREFERGGITLPEDQKKRVQDLMREISRLGVQFEQNIVAANVEAGIHLRAASELEGCDQDLIREAREAAQQRHLDGYWVSYSEPHVVAVLKDCQVRATREAMHKMSSTRALRNKPVAERIIAARHEQAHLLGFKNHAEYVLEKRMAKLPARAHDFMAELVKHYKPKAREEHAALQEFARQYEKDPSLTLGPSDIDMGMSLYYANLQRQALHGFNEKEISEYLPLPAVREAMFDVLRQLYGLNFAASSQKTWHKEVEAYEITSDEGQHLATVWCDWYAREGKRGGAWQNTYFTDDRRAGVSPKPTLGYVVCNFPTPHEDKPSLLSLRDVETMWHEFGHFIHAALSKTELREQASMSCKWDFVEAPSQIMENWVWQPEIFRSFARHYASGESLDDAVVEKIMASRHFRTASASLRQCYFALLDLALYMSEPIDDVVAFARQMKADFIFVPVAEYEASVTNFSHIFAGGYAAGYYGYKWAEAIEADLFSRFVAEGILNPAVGHDYAEKILGRGDEADPEELIRDFLGRDFTVTALLRRDGIYH